MRPLSTAEQPQNRQGASQELVSADWQGRLGAGWRAPHLKKTRLSKKTWGVDLATVEAPEQRRQGRGFGEDCRTSMAWPLAEPVRVDRARKNEGGA